MRWFNETVASQPVRVQQIIVFPVCIIFIIPAEDPKPGAQIGPDQGHGSPGVMVYRYVITLTGPV